MRKYDFYSLCWRWKNNHRFIFWENVVVHSFQRKTKESKKKFSERPHTHFNSSQKMIPHILNIYPLNTHIHTHIIPTYIEIRFMWPVVVRCLPQTFNFVMHSIDIHMCRPKVSHKQFQFHFGSLFWVSQPASQTVIQSEQVTTF